MRKHGKAKSALMFGEAGERAIPASPTSASRSRLHWSLRATKPCSPPAVMFVPDMLGQRLAIDGFIHHHSLSASDAANYEAAVGLRYVLGAPHYFPKRRAR